MNTIIARPRHICNMITTNRVADYIIEGVYVLFSNMLWQYYIFYMFLPKKFVEKERKKRDFEDSLRYSRLSTSNSASR